MIIFVGFLMLGGIFIFGKQIFSSSKEMSNPTKSTDEKIKVVQDFWQEALSQRNVEKYITATPQEFYDETPRCAEKKLGKDDEGIKMFSNNGFARDLKRTAVEIGNGKFTLVNAEVYKYWEKEAIVDVDFAKTQDQNITEKIFFYMYLVDGKWKIFMDTKVATLQNKEYANFDCSNK